MRLAAHGTEITGLRIPLGAAVAFKPPATQEHDHHSLEGESMEGVLAGYEIGPGYAWPGLHKVLPLQDFADTDLSTFAKALTHIQRAPRIAKCVELAVQGIYCPMRAAHDRLNRKPEALAEVVSRQREEHGILALPPADHAPTGRGLIGRSR